MTDVAIFHDRPYLSVLNFTEALLAVIFQIISVTVMSSLLYCAATNAFQIRQFLSGALIIYMGTHLVFSIPAFPYFIYTICNWRPVKNVEDLYDANTLYVLGMHQLNYLTVAPIPLLFLTLDRLFALKIPVKYKIWLSRWVRYMSIISIAAVFVASTVAILTELPLRLDIVQECVVFSCIMIKSREYPQYLFRLIVESVNLLAASYLLLSMRTMSKFKTNDLIIRQTLILDICLNIIPTFFWSIFYAIAGETPGNYYGQYPIMLGALDATCCSILYLITIWRKVRSPSKKKVNNFVTATSSTHRISSNPLTVTARN
ncbi:hypothetical protein DdX_16823 [Ditylenchus destructor]|uniref:Uncharacterized protein n=1 Tax=Ditylenchus destructor TaxID=166010 RepID=A0AAD4QZL2_9BILA|nr:hypothetical protein DdX_16823 [Ditylenchus destructor]